MQLIKSPAICFTYIILTFYQEMIRVLIPVGQFFYFCGEKSYI